MTRRLLPYGASGVLVECADLSDMLALVAALRQESLPEAGELVPGARSVLVMLRRPLTKSGTRLLLTAAADPEQADPNVVSIEVSYDGEDLHEVAELLDSSPAEVVRAHTSQTWTVAFCGFAPGFGYLVGSGALPSVPRRTSPRTRVPAGAVGLAGEFSGVYPREGPGGWQLIGRTELPMWDLERDPPALLTPGTHVRFVDVAGDQDTPAGAVA